MSPDSISSIRWLNLANGGIRLTPIFKGSVHPHFVDVTQEEFSQVEGDEEAMKRLALDKIERS